VGAFALTTAPPQRRAYSCRTLPFNPSPEDSPAERERKQDAARREADARARKGRAKARAAAQRDYPYLSLGEAVRQRTVFGQVIKVLKFQYGLTLPDDDAGRDSIRMCFDLHAAARRHNAATVMSRLANWFAPWLVAAELNEMIAKAIADRRYWSPADIGDELNLTKELRTQLGVNAIRYAGQTGADMVQAKRTADAKRACRNRRKRGAKPHEDSDTRRQPWKAAGFNSRRTWQRHGKPAAKA
jgi:hypothetical protein